ncbi:MAG: NAD(+) kinase [Candidatus Dadabacteria bacterium]|nr:MAG: NAD(+) kinase [Candidatus Dadabacteria bacterium]
MPTFGLVIRKEVDAAVALGEELLSWCKDNDHHVVCEEETARALGLKEGISPREMANSCDPIIALGGDGTLIGVARYVDGVTPVMLGVNFGRLGFLTEVAPDELFQAIETTLGGTAQFGKRHMLYAEVIRGGKTLFSMQAVNDAVLQKGTLDKLLELDLSVNEQKVSRYRCDGLIISTPTGSTAYNLSAGGPIVHPTLNVCVVSPICSHSLTHRPLVLSLDSELKVYIPPYDGHIYLSIDGQEGYELKSGDYVRIVKAKNSVIFVRSPSRSYFQILRDKLNWGAGNGS